MKRQILIAGLMTVLASFATAQTSDSRTVGWTFAPIDCPVGPRGMAIEIDGFDRSKWALGVMAHEGDGQIIVGGAVFGVGAALRSVENWPPENVSTSRGVITIEGVDEARGNAIILLRVPAGTMVRVSDSTSLVAAASVGEKGLLISGGHVEPAEVRGARTVLASFNNLRDIQNRPVLRPQSDGTYRANMTQLARNLTRFERTTFECEERCRATITVRIDESGRVTDILKSNGDAGLAEACAANLRHWEFSPFLIEGSPVVVTALISFRGAGDGRVLSPVLEEINN